MPKRIGLRTVKTCISVFICLMIYVLLMLIEKLDFVPDNFAFCWFNPFFAGIATAYSVHSSKKKSIEQAKNRCVASLIGGIVGIAIVMVYELIAGKDSWPLLQNSPIESYLLPYGITALAVILVTTLGLAFHQPNAIFVAILTLLSVTVNPKDFIVINYGYWVFGINRILSTMIGVLVALMVNLFRLPKFNKNKDLLFCIGIEGLLKNETSKIAGFFNFKLNDAYQQGINATLYTTRTPMAFMHLFDDVDINRPVICFSGAALYDTEKHVYINQMPLAKEEIDELELFFKKHDLKVFKNRIINNTLDIEFEEMTDMTKMYFDSKKDVAYCNIHQGVSNDYNVLYYQILDTKDKIQEIEKLLNEELPDKYYYSITGSNDSFNSNDEYKDLKIYNKEVYNLTSIKKYCSDNKLRLVGLTASNISNHLLSVCDYQVTFMNNEEAPSGAIKLKDNNYDALFKMIHKMYYSKKYKG